MSPARSFVFPRYFFKRPHISFVSQQIVSPIFQNDLAAILTSHTPRAAERDTLKGAPAMERPSDFGAPFAAGHNKYASSERNEAYAPYSLPRHCASAGQ